MPENAPGFWQGLWASLPIALGYAPIAFSFGVAATQAGLSMAEAVAFSVFVFAGASQFLAIALLTSAAPLVISALTMIAMNLRHVVYAPALLKQAGADARKGRAWLWSFTLTDEVFGAALGGLARGQRFSETRMTGLGFGAYAAWVGGTAAGAYTGGGALQDWPVANAALGFMLPALFLALLLSIMTRVQMPVIGVACVVTVAVSLTISATAGILAGMVAGALVGAFAGAIRR